MIRESTSFVLFGKQTEKQLDKKMDRQTEQQTKLIFW